MLTQFQRILQSPSSERELTEDELFNRRLDAVMSILIIVGFTREEGIDFMENLHVFSLDHLVVVTTEVINGQLVELGIAECRHVHLRTGLETFSQHYTSHDNSSGNDATTVQNTFDVASYTPALHRRIAFTSPTRGDGMTITQPDRHSEQPIYLLWNPISHNNQEPCSLIPINRRFPPPRSQQLIPKRQVLQ
jgi:hypothetical protein